MKNRVYFFDILRGFAIICMAIYHFLYDLYFFEDVNNKFTQFFFTEKFDHVQTIFANLFILISGAACIYSRNNLKRGVQCFALGMLCTFVTAFTIPESPIYFGILHFLGFCMCMFGILIPEYKSDENNLLNKISSLPAILLLFILYFCTEHIPDGYLLFKPISVKVPDLLYEGKLLFPLGFFGFSSSSDYFPIIPFVFIFFVGCFLGKAAKQEKLPKFFYEKPKNNVLIFLSTTGKYTLWIYIIHQPVIAGGLYLYHFINK